MKIDRVILSSNESKEYLDFWPIVSLAWKKIGIEPTLIYTGKIPVKFENVININLPNIDSAFLAQNVRLLAPSLFPDEVVIISDIDDMPLSKNYFQKNISVYENDKFIIYRPDAVPENMISIMWNVATGNTWSEIFNVKSIDDIKKTLTDWYPEDYKVRGDNWYFDQIMLKDKVELFKIKSSNRIIELSDQLAGFNRLNRSKLKRRFNQFYIDGNDYSDFHMPRPYSKYKKLINKVFELTFN
tara:strand:- start:75 stop:800 length:726 start_codon:yes stop_codon:yes gene_type:complete